MNEGQWLAWYIFGNPSERPVCIQFLTEMHEGSCQVRLKSGLCIIVPKKLVAHFTPVDDPQWPVVDRTYMRSDPPITDEHRVNDDAGKELARAASNALGALAFEHSKYGERWRSPDKPRPRD